MVLSENNGIRIICRLEKRFRVHSRPTVADSVLDVYRKFGKDRMCSAMPFLCVTPKASRQATPGGDRRDA